MGNGLHEGDLHRRYVDAYMALFEIQGQTHGLDGRRLWLPIDTSATQDVSTAIDICRRAFKSMQVCRDDMAGSCFSRVFDASIALCHARIRHSVTVGNVLVEGIPYYAVSAESIGRDFDDGYLHERPAVAHAWITLENGILLDFTLLYSIARRQGKRPPKLIKGVYRSDMPCTKRIVHVPLLLGPMYDILVVTMPNPAGFEKACVWTSMISDFVGNLDAVCNA